MAVSDATYLKALHDDAKNTGDKVISSDFMFEILGNDNISGGAAMFCKQVPFPVLSPEGEIEIISPMGSKVVQPQQVLTAKQGAISFMEDIVGSVDNMTLELLLNQGVFDAKVYEGTVDYHVRVKTLRNCFIVLDDADRDWENRSQVLEFTGTLHFHYYGEDETGDGYAGAAATHTAVNT